MPELETQVVVVDVLGTLVDEPAGIRAAVRDLVPSLDAAGTERLASVWRQHVDHEQQRVLDGDRAYVPSDVLDREAARLVAATAGVDDPAAVAGWRCRIAGSRGGPTPRPGWPASPNGSR